jgi:F1F0 ATPase subunit 2
MNELLTLVLAGLAGVLLGGMFFGGLWWTVRRGVASAYAAPWFMVSLLVRMGLLLAGIYVVGHGQWERMFACVLGFIVARAIVTRVMLHVAPSNPRAQEVGHAT